MSIKEKLESLGRNSIQLKIAGKETHKLGATRFDSGRLTFLPITYPKKHPTLAIKNAPCTITVKISERI